MKTYSDAVTIDIPETETDRTAVQSFLKNSLNMKELLASNNSAEKAAIIDNIQQCTNFKQLSETLSDPGTKYYSTLLYCLSFVGMGSRFQILLDDLQKEIQPCIDEPDNTESNFKF